MDTPYSMAKYLTHSNLKHWQHSVLICWDLGSRGSQSVILFMHALIYLHQHHHHDKLYHMVHASLLISLCNCICLTFHQLYT